MVTNNILNGRRLKNNGDGNIMGGNQGCWVREIMKNEGRWGKDHEKLGGVDGMRNVGTEAHRGQQNVGLTVAG